MCVPGRLCASAVTGGEAVVVDLPIRCWSVATWAPGATTQRARDRAGAHHVRGARFEQWLTERDGWGAGTHGHHRKSVR